MTGVVIAARCVLAAVFLAAAAGKIRDRAGARQAIVDFGLPERYARAGAVALPAAELLVTGALLVRQSALAGAAGAVVLLAVFSAAIVRALARGEAPACHCFGQVSAEPVGWPTLARNTGLAALAILVLAAAGGSSITSALDGLGAAQIGVIVVSVVALALAALAWSLWQRVDTLARQLERERARGPGPGLRVGSPAPDIAFSGAIASATRLSDLVSRRPVMLVFVSTHCGPCVALLPDVARWQRTLAEALTVVPVFSGEAERVRGLAEEHGLNAVHHQESDEAFEAYAMRATPSGVLVGTDGRISSRAAEGAPAIEALIRSVTDARERVAAAA